MLRTAVAAEVRAEMARKQPRISQWDLAVALGRSQSYVNRRLLGETPFDLDDLEKIAAYFDVPLTNLLPRLDSNQEPAGSRLLQVS